MLSLDVYKYITSLAHIRADYLSLENIAGVDAVKTFPGSDFTIHVLTDHAECQQVLTDATFVQPKIADAIKSVLAEHAEELGALDLFLKNNPIQMDGQTHRTIRQKFLRDYKVAQKAAEPGLYDLADRSFCNFIDNGSTAITKEVASGYVDGVIGLILSKRYGATLDAAAWSGESSSIFEFFHAPKRLKEKGRQVSDLLKTLDGNPAVTVDQQFPVLLSYLLQGRDPLIGALAAYMHWLAGLTDEERAESVAQMTSRELFWRASPVNYIGRTATRNVALPNVSVKQGDQLILVLPWANHGKESSAKNSMAFGAGSHICGGQALALSIADAWLAALRSRLPDIDWGAHKRETVIPAVFRQYKGQQ